MNEKYVCLFYLIPPEVCLSPLWCYLMIYLTQGPSSCSSMV